MLTTLTGRGEYAEAVPVSAAYATVLHPLGLHDAATMTGSEERHPSAGYAKFEQDGRYYVCSMDVSERSTPD